MVRPCVARGFVELAFSGLASMYPVSDWSCFAPDQYGYQRACDLINGQASTGPCGSPGFARAGKTDPPSLLILSQTSAGKGVITSSIASLGCAVPLFVPGGRFFFPTCGCRGAPRPGTLKGGPRGCV